MKVDSGVPTSAAGIIMPSAIAKKSTRGEVVSTAGETVKVSNARIMGILEPILVAYSDIETRR